LITFADFEFMRAEIAARGIVPGGTEGFYSEGVAASINYYGKMATDGQILDYYAEPGVGMQVAAPYTVRN
jgi:hypothetical protein